MKTRLHLITAIFLFLLLALNANSFAADKGISAIQQMATIMHRLKHFPSPQGKDTLKAIIDNKSTTVNERTLATAMVNLQHMAIAKDKPKLQAVINSKNASADEKTLAMIILNLNHRPTSEDKKKLKAMMN